MQLISGKVIREIIRRRCTINRGEMKLNKRSPGDHSVSFLDHQSLVIITVHIIVLAGVILVRKV